VNRVVDVNANVDVVVVVVVVGDAIGDAITRTSKPRKKTGEALGFARLEPVGSSDLEDGGSRSV